MDSKLEKNFFFKQKQDQDGMMLIHPILLIIFADLNHYCWLHGQELVITRVIDEKIDGVSVSRTHEEGRAIDIRTSIWPNQFIQDVVQYLNDKYADEYGAFSLNDGLPRLAVYHKGTAYHLHLQIRRLKKEF